MSTPIEQYTRNRPNASEDGLKTQQGRDRVFVRKRGSARHFRAQNRPEVQQGVCYHETQLDTVHVRVRGNTLL